MFDCPFSAGDWVVELKPPFRLGRVWRVYSHGVFARRSKLKNWTVVYFGKEPIGRCIILLRRATKEEIRNGKPNLTAKQQRRCSVAQVGNTVKSQTGLGLVREEL